MFFMALIFCNFQLKNLKNDRKFFFFNSQRTQSQFNKDRFEHFWDAKAMCLYLQFPFLRAPFLVKKKKRKKMRHKTSSNTTQILCLFFLHFLYLPSFRLSWPHPESGWLQSQETEPNDIPGTSSLQLKVDHFWGDTGYLLSQSYISSQWPKFRAGKMKLNYSVFNIIHTIFNTVYLHHKVTLYQGSVPGRKLFKLVILFFYHQAGPCISKSFF